MSRYIVKAMYLKKTKCLIIWNGGSTIEERWDPSTFNWWKGKVG